MGATQMVTSQGRGYVCMNSYIGQYQRRGAWPAKLGLRGREDARADGARMRPTPSGWACAREARIDPSTASNGDSCS